MRDLLALKPEMTYMTLVDLNNFVMRICTSVASTATNNKLQSHATSSYCL